jgi:hypothetical protein
VHVAFVVVYNIAAAVDHDAVVVAVAVVVVQCYIDHGTSFDFANVGDASAVMMENRAPYYYYVVQFVVADIADYVAVVLVLTLQSSSIEMNDC